MRLFVAHLDAHELFDALALGGELAAGERVGPVDFAGLPVHVVGVEPIGHAIDARRALGELELSGGASLLALLSLALLLVAPELLLRVQGLGLEDVVFAIERTCLLAKDGGLGFAHLEIAERVDDGRLAEEHPFEGGRGTMDTEASGTW